VKRVPGSKRWWILAVGAALALLGACPGTGSTSSVFRVQVTPIGPVDKVVFWDPERGFELEQKPGEHVVFDAPLERLQAPRVTVVAKDGSETVSGKIAVSAVTSLVDVGVLRVWSAGVDFKRDGDKLRFSWPPLSVPEAPPVVRYSLLFVYKGTAGQDMEACLVSKGGLEAIQTLGELSEVFPERDPAVKTMTLRIRAYSNDQKEGPLWAGPKIEWQVPADLPVQQGAR
jgi:hypothetical protein